MTPSQIFLALCLALLLGLFVGSYVMAPVWFFLIVIVIVIVVFLGSFPWRHAFGSVRWLPLGIGIVTIGFTLGIMRTNLVNAEFIDIRAALPYGQKVELMGQIVQYPDARLGGTRYVLEIEKPTHTRVLVFAPTNPAYSYGDVIAVHGKLQAPYVKEDFDYAAFLAKDGIMATLSAREISKVGPPEPIRTVRSGGRPTLFGRARERGMVLGRALAAVRAKTEHTIERIMPQQDAALLLALLIGDEGAMTEDFKEALNRSGLRHIVAVSGMNITIIAGMLSAFFISLGIPRKTSFFVTVFVVASFVMLIGAPASAVRAALMGLCLGLAPIIGRQSSGLRILIFALALMAFLSPLSLRADLGFQLSFLAMLGIVLFSAPLTKIFSFLPETLGIRSIVPMTLAAQMTTLPLLVISFGRVSLLAPFTNLLVLPLLPYATIIGFVAVGLGALLIPLGFALGLVLQPYFAFVRLVAEFSASLRFAAWENLQGGNTLFFGWMCAVVFAAWYMARAKKWPIDELEEYQRESA